MRCALNYFPFRVKIHAQQIGNIVKINSSWILRFKDDTPAAVEFGIGHSHRNYR